MKLLKIIIEYGLYFLVFILPIQARWIIQLGESEYGTISLYGTDILLAALIVLFVVFQFSIFNFQFSNNFQFSIFKHKIWWLILGLDLAIFVSIFFAEDKLIAIYKYAVFLLGIGLFWLIASANYNKLKLIYCFLAGIFLQASLGIWQFLTQSSFACKWLGLAEHDAGELGTSVIETISSIDGIGERWLRAYGGLDHPNVLGGLMVVGILFLVHIIICKKSKFNIVDSKFSIFNFQFSNPATSLRDNGAGNFQFSIFKQNIIFSFFILTSYFLLLTALFFTFSRGAWLGLAISMFIMLAILVVKKDLLGQKKLLQIILASSILIFILFSQFQDLVLTRLSNDARLEVKSNVERIESYKDSWEMIKDNWLFGVGIGNYTRYNANLANKCQSANCEYANANQPSLAKLWRGEPASAELWRGEPVHNVFLLIWAEIGIIGFLFFVSLLLFTIYYLLFTQNVLESKNLILRMALLAAIFTMFTVDHWFWSLHFGVLLFWVVMGLLVRKLNNQESF